MMVTDKDIAVLVALAEYYVLSCAQLHTLCFAGHRDRRATRKRLSRLVHHGYIARMAPRVSIPSGNVAPAYFPAPKGVELLAAWFDDERYLAVNTRRPRIDLLWHWLEISETHIAIAQAVAQQQAVKLEGWFNEWETINKDASQPEQFFLQTLIREQPPLSCSPDAAFMLSMAGHKKVFYLEQDRGTSGSRQVAAAKTPGYAAMNEQQLHRRHFPEATLDRFSVLCVTSDAKRRQALQKAIAKKSASELWLFTDRHELTPESFLHGQIIHNCKGELASLIKGKPAAVSNPS
jgi:hypothetical protein